MEEGELIEGELDDVGGSVSMGSLDDTIGRGEACQLDEDASEVMKRDERHEVLDAREL